MSVSLRRRGLAGCDAPRTVFLRGFQALVRCIMAGMDQQEQSVYWSCLGVYRFPVFMGDDFMFSPYSALSLVRQRIHAVRQSMERKNFVFFYMKRWIMDPEIDSRSRNTFYCPLYLTVTCSLRRLRST